MVNDGCLMKTKVKAQKIELSRSLFSSKSLSNFCFDTKVMEDLKRAKTFFSFNQLMAVTKQSAPLTT